PYLSALWFRLFGVSLATLVWVNLATLALFLALLYALLRAASDALAATIACLAFVVLFAFGQFVGLGNYNYVTPYTQEVVHGVMLSTIAIACAWRYLRHRHIAWALLAGLATGLAALTDAQVCVAGLFATIVIIALARPTIRGG